MSWFEGGEVFRSGCCFRRGQGRIFYFRPGHETYPTYHQPLVQQVIGNAVGWAPGPADQPEMGAHGTARSHRLAQAERATKEALSGRRDLW